MGRVGSGSHRRALRHYASPPANGNPGTRQTNAAGVYWAGRRKRPVHNRYSQPYWQEVQYEGHIGIPKGRIFPLLFGMYVRHTGCGT